MTLDGAPPSIDLKKPGKDGYPSDPGTQNSNATGIALPLIWHRGSNWA
jgi:hypothetical protein